MKTLSFLIHTNIYISLAAVSLTLATQVQLGMQPHLHAYLVIIFFGTLFDYNLHRIIAVNQNPEAIGSGKYSWAAKHISLLKIISIASLAGIAVASFFVSKLILYFLTPFAILTLLYSIPVFKKQKSRFRFKEIAGLKIFLIAFVWASVTIVLPVLESANSINYYDVLLTFSERFLFIFAITIPFDIRDMKADALAGVKTMPIIIGEKKSLFLGNLALLLSLAVSFIHYLPGNLVFVLPVSIVVLVFTFILLNSRQLRNQPYYHYGLLDGSMILFGGLMCLAYYFNVYL